MLHGVLTYEDPRGEIRKVDLLGHEWSIDDQAKNLLDSVDGVWVKLTLNEIGE